MFLDDSLFNKKIQSMVSHNRDEPMTHLFMSGGKAQLSGRNAINFFNAKYARAVSDGLKLTVTEKCPSKFVFFMDIDTKQGVGEADVISTTEHVLKCACKFWDLPDTSKAVVSVKRGEINLHVASVTTSESYLPLCDASVPIAESCTPSICASGVTGYHIHIPDIVADFVTMSVFVLEHGLKDICDMSVYRSGLRMLYSYKCDMADCYVPFLSVSMSEEDDQSYILPIAHDPKCGYDSLLYYIRQFTIIPADPTITNTRQKSAAATRQNSFTTQVGHHGALRGCSGEVVSVPTETIRLLLEPWKDLPYGVMKEYTGSLKRSIAMRDSNSIVCVLSSKRCMNLDPKVNGGRHSNNHVYLVLTPNHISQRCQSINDGSNRLNGSCCNFRFSRSLDRIESAIVNKLLLPSKDKNTNSDSECMFVR